MAGDKECNGSKSDGNDEKGCGRVTATAPNRAVAAATRAAGDEEGNGEGDESDGDAYEERMVAPMRAVGDEEVDSEGGESDGDGDKEVDGEEEAAGSRGGGRFASTTTTRLGSTVEASSSASSAASPATSKTMNVVEHPSFEFVRKDDVPEYGAACIISCDRCD